MMRAVAWAIDIPVFSRLCVSLADTPMQNIPTSHARPRSSPFSFSTSAESVTPSGLPSSANSRSVSAICGTLPGWTNDPTWMTSTPAAISSRIHRAFCSVGTTCCSIWSPSRGPTSWSTIVRVAAGMSLSP